MHSRASQIRSQTRRAENTALFSMTFQPASAEHCFDTVLHFHDKSKPDVNLTLTEGEFTDFAYRAFARYFISPDDRWILRIQHLGGGTNEAFLYSVAPDGRVRRREISNPVFDRIGKSSHRSINGRTQIELASWDIPSGSVHLERLTSHLRTAFNSLGLILT